MRLREWLMPPGEEIGDASWLAEIGQRSDADNKLTV